MANKEISIIKDYWDWRSERIQITTGLFVTSVSMILVWLLSDNNIANSISHEYGRALITIYDTTQDTALHKELSKLSFTFLTIPRLGLHILTSCFIGLIALEISKIYGNRWGVIHSVWASLLYMVCPTIVVLIYAGDGLFILLGALCATLALYAELRFRYLDEDFYLISSVVFLALSLSLDLVSGLTSLSGIILSRLLLTKVSLKNFSKKLTYSYLALFLPTLLIVLQKGGLRAGHFSVEQTLQLLNNVANSPEQLIAHSKFLAMVISTALGVLAIITVLRVLAGTLWLKPLLYLLAWITFCFVTASFYIGGNHYLKDSSVIVATLAFYCSMPIAILLSFIALPAIDAVNKPISISMACIGCLSLSILLMFWGGQMYQALKKQVVMQSDLKEFRTISNQVSLSYPNKRVYLIGLPKSVIEFVTTHNMKLNSIKQEKVFNSSRDNSTSKLTFVNMLTSKSAPEKDNNKVVYLNWSDSRRTFLPLHHRGRFNFSFITGTTNALDIIIDPADTPILKTSTFTNTKINLPFIDKSDSDITVVAGKTAIIMWLPYVELDPSLCDKIIVEAKLSKNGFLTKSKTSKLKFLWIAENESKPYESDLIETSSGQLENNIFSNQNWLGKSTIGKIGIKFEPGKYTCAMKKITIGINKKRDTL